MQPPRSIATVYNGVRYRSKLEADWARAFDAAGIRHAYEPEGWAFGGDLCYLPDFYLPELRTIVEVKGILDARSRQKLEALEREAHLNHVLLVLAEAPAGERWARVGRGCELDYFDGFNTCSSCGRQQFFSVSGCRVCTPAHADASRDWQPPYDDAQWVGILRWWAREMVKHGRMDDAEQFIEAAVRQGQGA